MILLFIRVCFCNLFLKQYFSYLKKQKTKKTWLTGMIKKDQNGAIIQLFTHVENLPSGNIFSCFVFFVLTSKHTKSHSMLPRNTDWHVQWIKPHSEKGELSRSGAVLFVWLFRKWSNKHGNGALIKDRTVAFHFHCPRTYSSTDYIVPWQLRI